MFTCGEPNESGKQDQGYQPNDKWATYSGGKGQSQFPHPLCLVRHLPECETGQVELSKIDKPDDPTNLPSGIRPSSLRSLCGN
jgi:hypothetical protein